MGLVFFAVGRQPAVDARPRPSPSWARSTSRCTTRWTSGDVVLTALARALNVLGAGVVITPDPRGSLPRVATPVARVRGMGPDLGWRSCSSGSRRISSIAAGRSVPSWRRSASRSRPGHAVAGASMAVALVLVFFPAGPERRRWEWLAVAFAFVMALSRVYLRAHWLSDVVAGVLLGAGVALGVAATVSEIATTSSGDGGRSQARPGRGQSAMSGRPRRRAHVPAAASSASAAISRR